MAEEEYEHQKGFLYAKLNSDMTHEASDKFIPIIIKELGELKEQKVDHDTRR